MTLRVLDLFAGAGGFTIAGELAGGYETVAFCEIDKRARKVLAKEWPDVPIFEDVTKLKADDIDGAIDVITGGFPCQDLSSAGRGAGLGEGTRSGLFREMLRLACEIREKQGRLPYIIFENVARLLSGPSEAPGEWFGEFLWSLAKVGYDAEWYVLPATLAEAPHLRERVCVVAYANEELREELPALGVYIEAERRSYESLCSSPLRDEDGDRRGAPIGGWCMSEPAFCLPGNGVSFKSSGLSAGIMGNAIVPQVFAIPMRALREWVEE